MMEECGKEMRTGTCRLPLNHKGKRHSTVVFFCDGCQKTYRGKPSTEGTPHGTDEKLAFCFLCYGVPITRKFGNEYS